MVLFAVKAADVASPDASVTAVFKPPAKAPVAPSPACSVRAVWLSGLTVNQQASMVSFVLLFRLLGVMFLALLPLILVMKRPRGGGPAVGAH